MITSSSKDLQVAKFELSWGFLFDHQPSKWFNQTWAPSQIAITEKYINVIKKDIEKGTRGGSHQS
jgi:hypothetical protein